MTQWQMDRSASWADDIHVPEEKPTPAVLPTRPAPVQRPADALRVEAERPAPRATSAAPRSLQSVTAEPSWRLALFSELGGFFLYAVSYAINTATTIAGIGPSIYALATHSLSMSSTNALVFAGTLAMLFHLAITAIERYVWNYPTSGNIFQRVWQHLKHLAGLSWKTLLLLTIAMTFDVGYTYNGLRYFLSGKTIPIWEGLHLPEHAVWFKVVVGILSVMIALVSEPGMKEALARALYIAKHRKTWWVPQA